jgi:2-oxoisovalerate dehydrogenase E2 component (dihydrolipoyl transacylase)
MGAFQFKLPDIGEGTTEAEIVAWRVKVGDRVNEDHALVEIMTEKATVELSSPVAGVIQSLTGAIGEKVAVGSVLVTFITEDSTVLRTQKLSDGPVLPAISVEPELGTKTQPAVKYPPSETASGSRPAASPAVRRHAAEVGIKLRDVAGTGPQGRITHADLHRFVSGDAVPMVADYAVRAGVQEIPIIGMRRQIAERMQAAKRHIPHFSYVDEVDMSALEELSVYLNTSKKDDQSQLSVLPFFMLVMAKAIEVFPQVNALYDDEAGIVHRHQAVHIGLAVQTEKGLIVPVIRNVQGRDIWNLAAEIVRLAVAARDGKAKREELIGSTITLTSLGALGGVMATPVINRPEVAIICPNKIVERPVLKNGHTVVRKMMNLSSSFDHRVVDGADAAAFIQRLKVLLEHPAAVFMC